MLLLVAEPSLCLLQWQTHSATKYWNSSEARTSYLLQNARFVERWFFKFLEEASCLLCISVYPCAESSALPRLQIIRISRVLHRRYRLLRKPLTMTCCVAKRSQMLITSFFCLRQIFTSSRSYIIINNFVTFPHVVPGTRKVDARTP